MKCYIIKLFTIDKIPTEYYWKEHKHNCNTFCRDSKKAFAFSCSSEALEAVNRYNLNNVRFIISHDDDSPFDPDTIKEEG